jgi:hypothetical protein
MTVLSIEYPYWLMIVGILLFMLGRVGLALRQRSVDSDPLANAADQEPSEQEADVNEVEAYNRVAKESEKSGGLEIPPMRTRLKFTARNDGAL